MVSRTEDAYLDNLIATNKLVDVFPRSAVEEDTRQIDRALPRLEASFIDAGADIGVCEVVEGFVVGCFILGHELHANVGQVAAWEVDCFARWGFDLDCAVAEVVGEGGELGWDVSLRCF